MLEGTVRKLTSLFIITKHLYLTSFMYYAEAATEFAISLLQILVNNNSEVMSELQNLIEALSQVGL